MFLFLYAVFYGFPTSFEAKMAINVIYSVNVDAKILKCSSKQSGELLWRILAHFQTAAGVICYQAIW